MKMGGGLQPDMRALVLVGDAVEFGVLSRLIDTCCSATVKVVTDPQWPGLDPIDALVIMLADHDATISVDGTTATLAASKTSLGQLAEDIALFVEHNDIDEPGMHTHLVERQGENVDGFELLLEGPVLDVPK
jgi:hypothetical protein